MCGEQAEFSGHTADTFGSPPRVRGTDLALKLVEAVSGITPACAGNSK